MEESDKNIIGFMIPFEANNNEDYEIKLKHTLEDFAKKIDRPAFKKEGTLVADVKVICKKVIDAFDEAKRGNVDKAERIVEEILEEYKKFSFAVTELDKSYAFRGIAPFENIRSEWGAKEEYLKKALENGIYEAEPYIRDIESLGDPGELQATIDKWERAVQEGIADTAFKVAMNKKEQVFYLADDEEIEQAFLKAIELGSVQAAYEYGAYCQMKEKEEGYNGPIKSLDRRMERHPHRNHFLFHCQRRKGWLTGKERLLA